MIKQLFSASCKEWKDVTKRKYVLPKVGLFRGSLSYEKAVKT